MDSGLMSIIYLFALNYNWVEVREAAEQEGVAGDAPAYAGQPDNRSKMFWVHLYSTGTGKSSQLTQF
jgi:hypothetical protein